MIRTVLIACGGLLLVSPPALAAGDAGAGKQVAIDWCRSCHLVNGGTAVDGACPLAAIARDPKITPQKLSAFLAKPHGGMRGLSLSREEIDNLIAYIESLR